MVVKRKEKKKKRQRKAAARRAGFYRGGILDKAARGGGLPGPKGPRVHGDAYEYLAVDVLDQLVEAKGLGRVHVDGVEHDLHPPHVPRSEPEQADDGRGGALDGR